MKNRAGLLLGCTALAAAGLCAFLRHEIALMSLAAGATLAAIFLFLRLKRHRLITALCLAVILCCTARAGSVYAGAYKEAVSYCGGLRQATAYAVEPMSDSADGKARWVMRVTSVNGQTLRHPALAAVTVELNSYTLHCGDTLLFDTEFTQYGGYSAKNPIFSQLSGGIYLKAKIDGESRPQALAAAKTDLTLFMARNKQKLCALAEELFPDGLSQLFVGMLYGERGDMSQEMSMDFRYSGMAHLLAVSGIHIHTIALVIARLADLLLFFTKKRKTVSRYITLIAVWGFILLIGCPVSALRSGVMLTGSILAACLHRRADSLNSLGFSVAAILLIDPFAVCSFGFWMSVLASFGICVGNATVKRRLSDAAQQRLELRKRKLALKVKARIALHPEQRDKILIQQLKQKKKSAMWFRIRKKLLDGSVSSIFSTVGLLPVYLFFFGYLPLCSLVLTPLLSPLFTAIMLLGVLFTAFGLCGFHTGAAVCARILAPLLQFLKAAVGFAGKLSFAVLPLRMEFAVVFCVFWAVCLLLMHPKIRKRLFLREGLRRRSWAVELFLGIFFVLGLLFTQYYQYNITEVAAVGGYESKDVVLTAQNRAVIFVCYDSDDFGSNETAVYEYLKRRGVTSVEAVFLLMPTDGIPQGVSYLRRSMQVDTIYRNTYGIPEGYEMKAVQSGDTLLLGRIVATFAYSGEGLNVSMQISGHRIAIVQDVSLSERRGFSPDGCDALFLYDPVGGSYGEEIAVSAVIPLGEEVRLPYAVASGRTVLFSEEEVVITIDRDGGISLP